MSIYKIFFYKKICLYIAIFFGIITIYLIIINFNYSIGSRISRFSLRTNNNPIKYDASCQKGKDHCGEHSVWIKYKGVKGSYLKHVVNGFKAHRFKVFECENGNIPDQDWNVIWSHDYPFQELKSNFLSLNKTHCINHFPGTGFITNKVFLASSKLSSIPVSFRLPEDKSKLVSFSKVNRNAMFVQKSSNHRGIEIKKLEDMNFEDKQLFVQKFIHTPLLIDGYKFDIGVYTAITSVDPVRVYIFNEVLFRFCTEKYHPFSTTDSRKYVVGDDYRPTWKVPSLESFYKDHNLGMKGSFDLWLSNQNKDSNKVWNKVDEAIREVFYLKEHHIIDYSKPYPHNLQFFEVMRFDFIIDEDLNVHLMEANMSPNLSSAHFKENRLLYEQMVFNLLSLVGLTYSRCSDPNSLEEREMKCSNKDTVVFPEHCSLYCSKHSDCQKVDCQLCSLCKNENLNEILCLAFLEHVWKGSFKRVLPKPFQQEMDAKVPVDSKNLSHKNTLMSEWYRGKCLFDKNFCL